MKKIIIIGAGQLGSRHLQSLNNIDFALDILVVDPNAESLKTAELRFNEHSNGLHNINFSSHLKLEQKYDIGIIATSSNVRRTVIESLLNQSRVDYLILEKVLFSGIDDYQIVSNLLQKTNTKAWVNCPMRIMPLYSQLRELFKDDPRITYKVIGSNFGLASNAIHYHDHVAFITNCNQFSVNTQYLDKNIKDSKRAGYQEFTGTLISRYDNGSLLSIESRADGQCPVMIEISNSEKILISRQWQQKAWLCSGNSNWQWSELDAKIPFQSEMTSELVKDLLETGTCDLPTYQQSVQTHLQLLEPLKDFYLKNKAKSEMYYPFT